MEKTKSAKLLRLLSWWLQRNAGRLFSTLWFRIQLMKKKKVTTVHYANTQQSRSNERCKQYEVERKWIIDSNRIRLIMYLTANQRTIEHTHMRSSWSQTVKFVAVSLCIRHDFPHIQTNWLHCELCVKKRIHTINICVFNHYHLISIVHERSVGRSLTRYLSSESNQRTNQPANQPIKHIPIYTHSHMIAILQPNLLIASSKLYEHTCMSNICTCCSLRFLLCSPNSMPLFHWYLVLPFCSLSPYLSPSRSSFSAFHVIRY